jgi:hypothetical protein
MEETRPRWRDLCSQPPTANRHHLSRVGSGPRHDIGGSGQVERSAQPRLTEGGQPYPKE